MLQQARVRRLHLQVCWLPRADGPCQCLTVPGPRKKGQFQATPSLGVAQGLGYPNLADQKKPELGRGVERSKQSPRPKSLQQAGLCLCSHRLLFSFALPASGSFPRPFRSSNLSSPSAFHPLLLSLAQVLSPSSSLTYFFCFFPAIRIWFTKVNAQPACVQIWRVKGKDS